MKQMVKHMIRNLALATGLALALFSGASRAEMPYKVPDDGQVKEAEIVSLRVEANGFGQVIANPCDMDLEICDRLVGSISDTTVYLHWGSRIGTDQVRARDWRFATIVLDAYRNVVAIEFMD